MPDAPAPKIIFVNLPVKDLSASIAFYEAVGAVRNNDFADDSAQMVSFSDTIHVMLLTHERFSSFTARRIPNAHETAQVLLALSEESRAAVDATMARALAAGGRNPIRCRIMVSCTAAISPIWMAISGNLRGWIWRQPWLSTSR